MYTHEYGPKIKYLARLMPKDANSYATQECERAQSAIVQSAPSGPILTFTDFTLPLELKTDDILAQTLCFTNKKECNSSLNSPSIWLALLRVQKDRTAAGMTATKEGALVVQAIRP